MTFWILNNIFFLNPVCPPLQVTKKKASSNIVLLEVQKVSTKKVCVRLMGLHWAINKWVHCILIIPTLSFLSGTCCFCVAALLIATRGKAGDSSSVTAVWVKPRRCEIILVMQVNKTGNTLLNWQMSVTILIQTSSQWHKLYVTRLQLLLVSCKLSRDTLDTLFHSILSCYTKLFFRDISL